LIEGIYPFNEKSIFEVEQSILSVNLFPFEKTICRPLQYLILSMFNKDPHLRPAIKQIANHPIFKDKS
jgi:hypothetical protein